MTRIPVPVVRLDHGRDLPLPDYATPGSAGADLLAAVSEPRLLAPGERRLIPTGLSLALPQGYEAQVRSRSGLAVKHGVVVLNSPGTIDADYRGEVMVILHNAGKENFEVVRGMRIAQMVVAPVEKVEWQPCEALPESRRSSGGFGSTGT